VIFLIPVYPIAGSLASIALAATMFGTEPLGINDVVQFAIAGIATYAVLFLTFKYEQRASRSRAYRIGRDVLRLAAGVLVVIGVLRNEGTATPADTLFIAVFGIPLAFLAVKRMDRVFGAAGPLPPPKPARDPSLPPTFWSKIAFREPLAGALLLGLAGFILGRDAQLFTVAGIALALWAIAILAQVLWHGLGALFRGSARVAGAASRKSGGVLGALVYGVVLGAIAGAILTKVIDGRVQNEGIVIMAIVGVPIALIVNAIRRRVAA
jgi:hypothetical protein